MTLGGTLRALRTFAPANVRGARTFPRSRARRRAGMTLVEVLVALIIMAFAAGGITYSLSAIGRTRLRSACMTVAAASRYAYNRSISHGTTVRVVFDLDGETIGFEEGHGRITLARADDETRAELRREGEDEAAVDPWQAAAARLDGTLRVSFGASPFSPLEGQRFQTRPLGPGIRVDRLFVPHEPEPREEGHGAIYFFPGGQTEHAVVWLSDGADRVYSVETHPLTGRARIHAFGYEPEQLLDDGAGTERSEVDE